MAREVTSLSKFLYVGYFLLSDVYLIHMVFWELALFLSSGDCLPLYRLILSLFKLFLVAAVEMRSTQNLSSVLFTDFHQYRGRWTVL
jgi:hypothetical protein